VARQILTHPERLALFEQTSFIIVSYCSIYTTPVQKWRFECRIEKVDRRSKLMVVQLFDRTLQGGANIG
jgi:hypothetical protein